MLHGGIGTPTLSAGLVRARRRSVCADAGRRCVSLAWTVLASGSVRARWFPRARWDVVWPEPRGRGRGICNRAFLCLPGQASRRLRGVACCLSLRCHVRSSSPSYCRFGSSCGLQTIEKAVCMEVSRPWRDGSLLLWTPMLCVCGFCSGPLRWGPTGFDAACCLDTSLRLAVWAHGSYVTFVGFRHALRWCFGRCWRTPPSPLHCE